MFLWSVCLRFKDFWKIFTPKVGEMIQFDDCNMFQMGWFNHQPVVDLLIVGDDDSI